MLEENVEILRETYESWNRGDLDAVIEFFDDDVVVRTVEDWPERVVRGKAAVVSFYRGYAETVGHNTAIEDLIDAGDSVVVRVRGRLSGDQTGIEVDLRFSHVTRFRDGKVVLVEYFWDHQEAIEAAGLSE
jgi:ketosteroid isomerase-like protein